MVAQRDAGGVLTGFTGVQIPGVLDDLYADGVADDDLGVTFQGSKPTFRLWAPTAQSGDAPHLGAPAPRATRCATRRRGMRHPVSGPSTGKPRSRATSTCGRSRVYAPTTGEIETNEVTDPYSVALTTNSERSVAIDLDDKDWRPKAWEKTKAPVIDRPVDRAIYELHIRDFSITRRDGARGGARDVQAFTRRTAPARRSCAQLADAGHQHRAPAAVVRHRDDRGGPLRAGGAGLRPRIVRPRTRSEQQACVNEIRDADGFNWGYDPYHFSAPEGSYAVDPEGGARVAEFR